MRNPTDSSCADRAFGTDQGAENTEHRCIRMGRVFCWDDCLCGNSEYGHPGDCVLGDRMVPQFLFYAFAYLIVLWYFFTVPQSRWNLGKTLFVLLFMAAGLITEAYVNPILMQMFLDTL